jgi:hypothetical protein
MFRDDENLLGEIDLPRRHERIKNGARNVVGNNRGPLGKDLLTCVLTTLFLQS